MIEVTISIVVDETRHYKKGTTNQHIESRRDMIKRNIYRQYKMNVPVSYTIERYDAGKMRVHFWGCQSAQRAQS